MRYAVYETLLPIADRNWAYGNLVGVYNSASMAKSAARAVDWPKYRFICEQEFYLGALVPPTKNLTDVDAYTHDMWVLASTNYLKKINSEDKKPEDKKMEQQYETHARYSVAEMAVFLRNAAIILKRCHETDAAFYFMRLAGMCQEDQRLMMKLGENVDLPDTDEAIGEILGV